MIVETKIVGRRIPLERRPLELVSEVENLRGLLEQLVRAEVDGYNGRQASVGVLRVLTERELDAGAAAGKVSVGPQAAAPTADPDEAVAVALRAYGDGMYFVFVDDLQIMTLDEPLSLRPDSTLMLLRLTPLAGG
ncbi:hypothetical protein [Deinococcus aquatilis]|jgi:hypothetical protein|uniref:hypothetical protein n=1 Tax=Deinococcus aquatilis TaxID=519440 RepID=UPI000371DD3E|nr:hypothetical protein [Deinococcus aquatilis]